MDVSKLLTQTVSNQINKGDVSNMMDLQNEMLKRFEKTNEMLLNFNNLSSSRFKMMEKDWRRHVLLLANSKKDLEIIFKRIRQLKFRLSKQYPQQFQACTHDYEVSDDEMEEKPKTPILKFKLNASDFEPDISSSDKQEIEISKTDTPTTNMANILDTEDNLSKEFNHSKII